MQDFENACLINVSVLKSNVIDVSNVFVTVGSRHKYQVAKIQMKIELTSESAQKETFIFMIDASLFYSLSSSNRIQQTMSHM